MNLVDLSIKRPIMMTMVIMTFVVLGLFSLTRLGIDNFPNVDFPFVVATIIYPGAGPLEMESLVAEPVEEQVSAIGGIRNVTSFSEEGMSVILMEFDLGVDVDIVGIDVKDKIAIIRNELPEDILDPIVQKWDFASLPIINLALYSPRPLEESYKFAEDVIKPALSKVRGIADIQLSGGKQREIHVNLSKSKLNSYNITPQMVIGMIGAANLNIPGGHVIESNRELTLRMVGEFSSVEEIRNIELPAGENAYVRLSDLGWVEDSFVELREKASFNGEQSIGLGLIKRSDANTVATANDVFKEVEKLQRSMPDDYKIDIARDMSQFIKDSVDDVFGNMILGVLLTVLVLYLFLHNIPMTVIAAISMPTSIIATFILVDFAGFTLNMMSLMGLAISVGILVANSIVVLENIERYRKQGLSDMDASAKGTREIAIAVAAATLTNIVVFTPMAFMSGIVGQFFIEFGLTVAFATLFSLLVSFTLTPMMSSRPLRGGVYAGLVILTTVVIYWRMGITEMLFFLLAIFAFLFGQTLGLPEKFAIWWNRLYDGLQEDYANSLKWAMKHKFIVFASISLLFIGSSALLPLGYIGAEFFPKTDQGMFTIDLELPVGTPLEETNRVVRKAGNIAMNMPYVKSVYTAVGKSESDDVGSGQGVNKGYVIVQMVDKDIRPMSTGSFLDSIRVQLTGLPDADVGLKESSLFGGGQSDIVVEVTGVAMDQLNSIADSILTYMNDIGGLVNVGSSWELGKLELEIEPIRSKLDDHGLSVAGLGMTIRNLVEGEIASKLREKGDEYDIRVQLDKSDLQRAEDIGEIYIQAGDNQVMLRDVVDLEEVAGPTSVAHKNKQRMVMVTADIASGTLGGKVGELRARTDVLNLPEGYGINFGGDAEMMVEAFTELIKAMVLAILLTYMLLAAILESYKHPFTIMLTLPLGMIGAMLALFITGHTISMFSLMALVMLVGIVVNNGILLIDYINQLRSDGKGLDDAIFEACPIRLRPIIMTNLATALGMLPLALGLGSGGEMRAPMAVVSIGGLLSSAVFTLYVIPLIYRLMEKDAKSV
ncbi:efflux RND transporter permease subunit [Calditrichota bacterium]